MAKQSLCAFFYTNHSLGASCPKSGPLLAGYYVFGNWHGLLLGTIRLVGCCSIRPVAGLRLRSCLQAVFATSPRVATCFVLVRTSHNRYTTIWLFNGSGSKQCLG